MTSITDLERLRRAHEETAHAYNESATILFHYELGAATHCLREDDPRDIRLEIAGFWMEAVAANIKEALSLSFNASQLDSAIALFDDETVLSTVLMNPDNAHYLACMCMERTKHAGGLRAQGPSLVERDFLERWSGREVEQDVLTKLEGTVNFLYGPAVWSLYAAEVKNEATIPAYLAANKVPLTGVMPNPGSTQTSEALPYDLS